MRHSIANIIYMHIHKEYDIMLQHQFDSAITFSNATIVLYINISATFTKAQLYQHGVRFHTFR